MAQKAAKRFAVPFPFARWTNSGTLLDPPALRESTVRPARNPQRRWRYRALRLSPKIDIIANARNRRGASITISNKNRTQLGRSSKAPAKIDLPARAGYKFYFVLSSTW